METARREVEWCPAGGDLATEDRHDADTRLTVRILEVDSTTFGLFLWPSATVLAQFLTFHPAAVRGRTVLELGAGVALPGLVAARLGATRVTVTDRAECPAIQQNAAAAIDLNGLSGVCTAQPLTWGDFSEEFMAIPKPHVLLGADCFYTSETADALLGTVSLLLRPGSVFYTTYHERSIRRTVRSLMAKWALTARVVPLREFLPPVLLDDPLYASIKMIVISKIGGDEGGGGSGGGGGGGDGDGGSGGDGRRCGAGD